MDRKAILEKAVLSTNSDAIIAADKEGTIFFWNPGAERIFGHPSADALGRSLDIIIPDRLRQRHWDGYRQVMKSGESRYGHGDVLAVPGTARDGSRISLEFTIIPLRAETGELIGLAAIMRDVTKRFEEMRALRQKIVEVTKESR
jgi:PAS domain S-box-containing protein